MQDDVTADKTIVKVVCHLVNDKSIS